ncbi:hypothetical protein ACJX0J_027454, partial [Zea mays]
GAKIEAITYMYETVKHFDNLLHEKHVYKMHNVKFSLHPGEFNFRHLNGPMELCLDQQTIVEPYTVPIQMVPFPKQILLNLADITELPNRTLVDIMAIVVHLDTIHRTMWGPFRKIVIMDARYIPLIELAIVNNTFRKAQGSRLPGIIEETRRSGESTTSTLESETWAMESLETELFDNVRASIQRSLGKPDKLSARRWRCRSRRVGLRISKRNLRVITRLLCNFSMSLKWRGRRYLWQ